MNRTVIVSVLLFVASTVVAQQKEYQSTWESIDSRPVPAWFEDAKFGIFIHWGLYSVPAFSPTVRDGVGIYERYAEWYWRRWKEAGKNQHYFTDFHNRVYGSNFRYQDFVSLFRAEMYDPNHWAEIFGNAGAKYVVLTSKHHEGYTLWPSAYAWNWNAVETGPHRDLLGDLTKAVKARGLKMGYYYSLLEWYNPLYKKETIEEYVDQHMIPQMKELVSEYSPDVFWTDGEWDYTSDILKSTSFLQWLFNESPVKETVAINDRWGKETRSKHGGYFTTEYDLVHDGNSKGMIFERPWEECRGMAGSFGYNRNERLEDYSTSEELIHILIDKVARGGNLLLNIGPTADGRIPEIMQQRLADMGKWLKMNGEAIYGTRSWANAPAINAETTRYFTRKGKDLYLIVTKWEEKPVTVSGVRNVTNVTMPGCAAKINYKASGSVLTIIPPVVSPASMTGRYAWVYKIENGLSN
jgi:alpha-L-fucosidase